MSMVEGAIVLLFLLFICGFIGLGEWLNEKYNWFDTSEDDNFEYQERVCSKCKKKVS